MNGEGLFADHTTHPLNKVQVLSSPFDSTPEGNITYLQCKIDYSMNTSKILHRYTGILWMYKEFHAFTTKCMIPDFLSIHWTNVTNAK